MAQALARSAKLDIVHGVRADRSTDTPFKRWTADRYYRLMRRLVGKTMPPHAGDFRLLSRTAIEALRQLRRRYRVRALPAGQVAARRVADAPRPQTGVDGA